MKCFHHNDIDGISAAAFVARFTNNYNPEDYIMHDYSKSLPTDLLSDGETVYVVDLSFSPNTINELKEIVEKKNCHLIWCDHHSSTMELLKDYPEYNNIEGLRQEGISGAALTWMYFEDCSFEECPRFIQMISDFDCWKFEIPGTMQFKYSLESEELTPFNVVWNNLVRDSKTPTNPILHDMIEKGFTSRII